MDGDKVAVSVSDLLHQGLGTLDPVNMCIHFVGVFSNCETYALRFEDKKVEFSAECILCQSHLGEGRPVLVECSFQEFPVGCYGGWEGLEPFVSQTVILEVILKYIGTLGIGVSTLNLEHLSLRSQFCGFSLCLSSPPKSSRSGISTSLSSEGLGVLLGGMMSIGVVGIGVQVVRGGECSGPVAVNQNSAASGSGDSGLDGGEVDRFESDDWMVAVLALPMDSWSSSGGNAGELRRDARSARCWAVVDWFAGAGIRLDLSSQVIREARLQSKNHCCHQDETVPLEGRQETGGQGMGQGTGSTQEHERAGGRRDDS